jgi:hypothetical protein
MRLEPLTIRRWGEQGSSLHRLEGSRACAMNVH